MSSSVQRAAIFLRTFPVKSDIKFHCHRSKSISTLVAKRCLPSCCLASNHGFNQKRLMSDKSSDDDKPKDENKDSKPQEPQKKTTDKSTVAKSKLNDLLQSIIKDTAAREGSDAQEKAPQSAVDLAIAAKEKKPRRFKKDKPPPPAEKQEVVLGKRIIAAVKKVSMTMEGNPDEIESELVQKLKSHHASKIKFSELVDGMKIMQSKPERDIQTQYDDNADTADTRADQVRQMLRSPRRPLEYQSEGRYRDDRRSEDRPRRQRDDGRDRSEDRPRRQRDDGRDRSEEMVNIYGGRPLGIFSPQRADAKAPAEKVSTLETWERLEAKELKLAVTHPPANGFEEMISWTEKGMLWTFPIDNEYGLDEEAKFSFSDHVFLEPYIESWCPEEGPLRQFMELVCIGLAKNPYLSVPEKREYLDWYYEYFKDKSAILKETGSGVVKERKQLQSS